MTRVEERILENQAAIISLLAQMVPDVMSAKNALRHAQLIEEQIRAWRDEETPRLPSDTEDPYLQSR